MELMFLISVAEFIGTKQNLNEEAKEGKAQLFSTHCHLDF